MNVRRGHGDPGCLSTLTIKAVQHCLLADYVTAEYHMRTEGRGRTVDGHRQEIVHSDKESTKEQAEQAVSDFIELAELMATF